MPTMLQGASATAARHCNQCSRQRSQTTHRVVGKKPCRRLLANWAARYRTCMMHICWCYITQQNAPSGMSPREAVQGLNSWRHPADHHTMRVSCVWYHDAFLKPRPQPPLPTCGRWGLDLSSWRPDLAGGTCRLGPLRSGSVHSMRITSSRPSSVAPPSPKVGSTQHWAGVAHANAHVSNVGGWGSCCCIL